MKKIKIYDYIYHGVFFFVYGIFKYFPSPIGDFFRKWILKIALKKSGKIRVYEGVTIWYPYNVVIGNNVSLNEFVYISGFGNVVIGNNVSIGHRTSIISSDHIFKDKDVLIKKQGIIASETVIGDNVFIGCNVTILKGVKIGEGCVIGAGSIVTKDVPSFHIYTSSGQKKIKER